MAGHRVAMSQEHAFWRTEGQKRGGENILLGAPNERACASPARRLAGRRRRLTAPQTLTAPGIFDLHAIRHEVYLGMLAAAECGGAALQAIGGVIADARGCDVCMGAFDVDLARLALLATLVIIAAERTCASYTVVLFISHSASRK